MLKAAYSPYTLNFNFKALTSRGALPVKDTFFIKIWDECSPNKFGLGECAIFKGLSKEDNPDYEQTLHNLCKSINRADEVDIGNWSSIKFGLETALNDFENGCLHTPFPGEFANGEKSITINGLVWMGSIEEMLQRAQRKLLEGFHCIKFKIGAEDFEQEIKLLEQIRKKFPPELIEIRLDANGAFTPKNALSRLDRLAPLSIHSIEQPIAVGKWESMANICESSPIPVALDEELIGTHSIIEKEQMLDFIKPSFVILKPSLCGGFIEAKEWIDTAVQREIGWWATSALESNVGLNAIAQWVANFGIGMPQGLGTGGLYTNNISSPLVLNNDKLFYDISKGWIFPELQWIIPE
ncbi:MAG: o-succinylbenzoate synthase [Paramuribaculum sp.]|nr:o-succinylbenzoate synthase [Paramuribaculum sp.]